MMLCDLVQCPVQLKGGGFLSSRSVLNDLLTRTRSSLSFPRTLALIDNSFCCAQLFFSVLFIFGVSWFATAQCLSTFLHLFFAFLYSWAIPIRVLCVSMCYRIIGNADHWRKITFFCNAPSTFEHLETRDVKWKFSVTSTRPFATMRSFWYSRRGWVLRTCSLVAEARTSTSTSDTTGLFTTFSSLQYTGNSTILSTWAIGASSCFAKIIFKRLQLVENTTNASGETVRTFASIDVVPKKKTAAKFLATREPLYVPICSLWEAGRRSSTPKAVRLLRNSALVASHY